MEAWRKIITVGLCPCWDTICRLQGLQWGEHKQVSSFGTQPAGKALNISRALAWMGQKSIAAGLWGRGDFQQMLKTMRPWRDFIRIKMTAVEGSTRHNITVVDTVNNRQMHLRSRSRLASRRALGRLKSDLGTIVRSDSICIFAGAMPEAGLLSDVVRIIKSCQRRTARIVVDTSGDDLRKIVNSCGAWLIKPNVEELSRMIGERIKDNPAHLVAVGRRLLDRVEVVLISRGRKGAIVVTGKGAWRGRCVGKRGVLSTVGCGDYLLAGFVKGLKDKSDAGAALKTAIKVATAKAWSWTENRWSRVQRQIPVEVRKM